MKCIQIQTICIQAHVCKQTLMHMHISVALFKLENNLNRIHVLQRFHSHTQHTHAHKTPQSCTLPPLTVKFLSRYFRRVSLRFILFCRLSQSCRCVSEVFSAAPMLPAESSISLRELPLWTRQIRPPQCHSFYRKPANAHAHTHA